MASNGVSKITEVFKADANWAGNSALRQLLQDVHDRGVEIAYEWLEKKAALGDTDVRIEVDGQMGKSIESWNKRIRLSWGSGAQLSELVYFLYKETIAKSPVDTGRLAASWQWQLNGSPISFSTLNKMGEGDGLQPGDRLRLINLQPYVRKAEVLYVKKGIVGPVTRAAKRRFRGFFIKDDWIEIPGHIVTRGIRGKASFRSQKLDQRVPSILIMRSKKVQDLNAGPTLG